MGASALTIETPRAFRPLLQPAKYRGAYGGRASGKSWFFADLLIEKMVTQPETRAICIREVQKSLVESVKRLVEDRIQALGVGPRFRVLSSHLETPHGGSIIFQGMSNVTNESIKSLEGFTVAWIEEAQVFSARSLELLRPTIMRREGAEIWASWNPRFPTDPVDDFFRGNAPLKPGTAWERPPESIVVSSTYMDNPWLTPGILPEIRRDRAVDPDKYAHIWLGDYERHSEARVFKNWTIQDFETPDDVTFYYGGDWGFSVDPTVLIRCFVNRESRTLYVDREVYEVGCEIDHTPALFDRLDGGRARHWPITADSARPETISYMQRHGYPRVRAAHKGQGSVEEGVTFLQNFKILVHPRCRHAIDEMTLYRYETDKLTGDVLPKLEDKKNHVIDALRYAVESLRIKTGAGFFDLAGL